MKKDPYNFKVFENYKCDGQYRMEFSTETVSILEEPKESKINNQNENKQEFNINGKLI